MPARVLRCPVAGPRLTHDVCLRQLRSTQNAPWVFSGTSVPAELGVSSRESVQKWRNVFNRACR